MTEPADIVATAVTSVPGVAALHAGMFGEVGTYLPGRRIPGVRLSDGVTDIHVTLFFGFPVRQTAARIRDVVTGVVGGTVNVTVEDVVAPATTESDPRRDTGSGGATTMTDSRWGGFPNRTSARRAAARSLHPDVGGDADQFAAALGEIDRQFGVWRGVSPTGPVEVLIRRSRGATARARLRAVRLLYRRTRGRLPLSRRRYFSL